MFRLTCAMSLVALYGHGVCPHHLEGQSSASGSVTPKYITGFAGFVWGASENQIIAKLGKPETTRPRGSAKFLAYSDYLLGHETGITLIVDPTLGLIKGMYSVQFGPGDGCETVLRELKEAISAKYPAITADETRYNHSSLDFCSGVMIGEAAASTSWTDPSNSDAAIAVIIKSGETHDIQVHYESPAFSTWSDNQSKSDTRF